MASTKESTKTNMASTQESTEENKAPAQQSTKKKMVPTQNQGWTAPMSWAIFVFSIVMYTYFFIIFIWFAAWLLNLTEVEGMDATLGAFLPLGSFNGYNAEVWNLSVYVQSPVLLNLLLTFFFTVPHSLMARPWMKELTEEAQRAGEISMYRSYYVCYSSLALHLTMNEWQPISGNDLWTIENPSLHSLLFCINVFGVVFVLTSTFAIDHFGLFGITQGTGFNIYKKLGIEIDGFSTRAHYSLCRHPIMFGMMIMFWATPVMTPSRFMFAFLWTTYIIVAVYKFEEHDMINHFPKEYSLYQQHVPTFCPMFKPFMSKVSKPATVDCDKKND